MDTLTKKGNILCFGIALLLGGIFGGGIVVAKGYVLIGIVVILIGIFAGGRIIDKV